MKTKNSIKIPFGLMHNFAFFNARNYFLSLLFTFIFYDTGFTQCDTFCINQVPNTNLEIQHVNFPIIAGYATTSFQRLWVPNGTLNGNQNFWFSSHNSPHHVMYQPPQCNLSWTTPNNSVINCLAANSGGYSEGVYTQIKLNRDPLTKYCISMDLRRLVCGFGSSNHQVSVAMTSGLTPFPLVNQTAPLPNNIKQILHTENYDFNSTNNLVNVQATFTPTATNNFNQLWVYTVGNAGTGFTNISNVKVTCTTDALSEILCSNTGNVYTFAGVNSSTVSNFVSFNWNFGDPASGVNNTSTLANPSHTFSSPGTYNVCLNIMDNNCCCATLCKTVVIPSPPSHSCADQSSCIQINGTSGNGVRLSDLINGPNPVIPTTTGTWGIRNIQNLCFSLQGKLIVDVWVDLINTHWYCGPGSTIEVSTSYCVLDNSVFQGCDFMWKGFTVPASQGIFFNNYLASINSRIQDAWRAIDINNNSALLARNTVFNNNVTGIYFGPSIGDNSIYNNIEGCIFNHLSNNLPAYPGMSEWSQNYEYGIYANNLSLLKVTESSIQKSLFRNLIRGIFAINSNIEVSKSIFEDLNILPNSLGISVRNAYLRTIINNDNEFFNLSTFILLDGGSGRSVVNIDDNTFLSTRNEYLIGIRALNHNTSNISILNNHSSMARGVHNHITGNLFRLNILKNVYTSSQSDLINNPIYITSVNAPSFIVGNEFHVIGNFYGHSVHLNNCSRFVVLDNTAFAGNVREGNVFNLTGIDRCLFRNNTSERNGRMFSSTGSQSVIGNGYCCNTSSPNSIPASVTFSSANGRTLFRQNSLQTLVLQPDGEIGPQFNAGNIWNGSSTALMQGPTILRANSNRFSTQTNIGLKPLTIIPSNLSQFWFLNIGLIPPTCATTPDCDIPNYFEWTYPSLTNPIPDTPRVVSPPTETCAQLLQNYTYYLSLGQSSDPVDQLSYWNAVVQLNYYTQIYSPQYWYDCRDSLRSDPNILLWNNVEQRLKLLDFSSSAISSQLNTIVQSSNLVMDSISTISSFATLTEEQAKLYASLNTNMIQYGNLSNQVVVERQSKAIALIPLIQALPVVFPFMQDRKTIWFYNTKIAAYGVSSIQTSEWDQIRNIAMKCPNTTGQAVFEAIGLMTLKNEFIVPLDDCIPVTLRSIVSLTSKDEMRVIPNPAINEIEVTFAKEQEIDHIKILDINGKLVLDNLYKSKERISIKDLMPGIYYVQAFKDKMLIANQKFVKIQ